MTTNPPPPTQQNFAMQPRGNTPAVLSLVLSLLGFCSGGLGGILGIILGIVGLKRAKETASGRGLAIAGIIIGCVTLLAWTAGGYGGWVAYKAARHTIEKVTAPPRDAARQYVIDLNKGDIEAAEGDSTGIIKDELKSESELLTPMGAFQDMTSSQFNIVNNVCTLDGVATFAKGTKNYTITVIPGQNTDEKWKVSSAVFH